MAMKEREREKIGESSEIHGQQVVSVHNTKQRFSARLCSQFWREDCAAMHVYHVERAALSKFYQ
jgi:hypothetical protein